MRSSLMILAISFFWTIAARAQTTATPNFVFATGTYSMPRQMPITDSTPGASMLWCSVDAGSCAPSASYTGAIYVDPTTSETICANAIAPGDSQSGTVCATYANAADVIATPAISLASGTYTMPQNTTISDSTSGASILWCEVDAGTCTPSTAYGGSIAIDPASTETICANATAGNYSQSLTTCNDYTAGQITFSYSKGKLTMSTALPNAAIFYTRDGSTATEASIEYTGPVQVPPGTMINAVAVQMSSNGNQGIAIQNDQTNAGLWRTNLACHAPGSATPAATQCPQADVSYYNSPNLHYCPAGTTNTGSSGCQGVQGIPSQVAMVTAQPIPGFGTAANLNFTDAGLYPGTADHGTQVLWPYATGSTGCDSCTGMVEDFYIWPGQNAEHVQNWELDMNDWATLSSPTVYRGASMQCSLNGGSWEYNGQVGSWSRFRDIVSTGYNHDCPLPTGNITAPLDSASCNFTVTPNAPNSTVEPGMILWFKDNNEEVFVVNASGNSVTNCRRGYAGTTAAAHDAGAAYSGSVHVQYHVSFIPGYTGYCHLRQSPATPAECIFIDYLKVNNFDVFKKDTYGTITVDGRTESALYVDASTIPTSYPDRIFDQKQIDVAPYAGYVTNPVQVGEYVDQDNVTASFGILARQSYTVPRGMSAEQ